MERLIISVNKNNLIRLEEELVFAQDGLELLDEKKEALMVHLRTLSTKAERVRTKVNQSLEASYRYLREALLIHGRVVCERSALCSFLNEDVQLREKSFMGVVLPHVRIELPKLTPPYGFYGTGAAMDSVIKSIYESIEMLAELAEIEVGLFRFVAEIKKTLRRLNALENIYIPLYKSTVKYIEENLEEKEREFFFQLKRYKERHKGVVDGAI